VITNTDAAASESRSARLETEVNLDVAELFQAEIRQIAGIGLSRPGAELKVRQAAKQEQSQNQANGHRGPP